MTSPRTEPVPNFARALAADIASRKGTRPLPNFARAIAADTPTLNLTFKIPSFSKVRPISTITSNMFISGGHWWCFTVFPSGPHDHISFALTLAGSSSYPVGYKVYAKFNIYLFHHVQGNFLKIAGNQGSAVRFEGQDMMAMATPSLLSTFLTDPSGGYLLDDQCMFGVEVLVCENRLQHDCLSLITGGCTGKFSWNMMDFTEKILELQKEQIGKSPLFIVGNYECGLMYCVPEDSNGVLENGSVRVTAPVCSNKSIMETENRFFSLYIYIQPCCIKEDAKCYEKVLLKVLLRLRDQSIRGEHIRVEDAQWLGKEMLGWPRFMELGGLTDPNKGYLVKDTLIIEAEVGVWASVKSSFG